LENPNVTLSIQPAGVGVTALRVVDELEPGSLCDAVEPLNGHEASGGSAGAVTNVVGAPGALALFALELHDVPMRPTPIARPARAILAARMIPPLVVEIVATRGGPAIARTG
jgi:hypothetical protein